MRAEIIPRGGFATEVAIIGDDDAIEDVVRLYEPLTVGRSAHDILCMAALAYGGMGNGCYDHEGYRQDVDHECPTCGHVERETTWRRVLP